MDRPSAPTMAHVARRAGVSHQTVSRVLNDASAVRPETRDRVLRAIGELGYRRNSAARALVTRRSGLIGVIVDELPLYGPASTVTGIAEAAREAGYAVTLDPLFSIDGATLAVAIEHHLSQAVEAIVLVTAHGEAPDAELMARADVPIIALDGFLGPGRPDRRRRPAGRRRDGDPSPPRPRPPAHRPHHRPGGVAPVRRPPRRVPRRPRPGRRRARARSSSATGRRARATTAILRILEDDPAVTAVFVANDQMAMGTLRALAERGLRVPDDVSVVGFDDIPEASFFQPPLTTIRQDFASLGRAAVRLVIGALAGEELESALVPPRLVTRASTARPPRRRAGRPDPPDGRPLLGPQVTNRPRDLRPARCER